MSESAATVISIWSNCDSGKRKNPGGGRSWSCSPDQLDRLEENTETIELDLPDTTYGR